MNKYPTFKTDLGPTPSETLYVCPKCGQAEWSHYFTGSRMPNCKCRINGTRMRYATEEETEEGKKALKTIIGNRHKPNIQT